MKKFIVVLVAILGFASSAAAAKDITVTKFATYISNINGFEAKIVTPMVRGLADRKIENDMNERFMSEARSLVVEYEKNVATMIKKMPTNHGHFGLISDFIIKTDNKDILAFDSYVLNIIGSSSTKHKFYTFNKNSGKLMTLKETVKSNPNYVSAISKYIKNEMARMNKKESGLFFIKKGSKSEFNKIKDNQNFYINNKGVLVICFDKYEVAAGAQGSPEFEIPSKIIKINP